MPKLGLGLSLPQTRVSGSAPVIPASGLSLWLKADAGVTLSGSNVTGWADQSGNGNNASANSGQEPTFASSFSNSKPAIEFNGTTQIMQIADANSLDFLTTSSFIVLKYIGQGTGNNIVYFKNANAGSPAGPAMYGLVGANGDNLVSFSVNVGGWADYETSISIANAVPKILSMTYDGTDQNVYSNGGISNTFSIVGNIATSTGLFQIGGYNQSFGASEYFYGQIAEVIMYNRAVTGAERQQVEAYLMDKYAIAPALPVATTTNVIVTFGDTSGINYARSAYPTYTFYSVDAPTGNISFQRLTFDFDVANTWSLAQYSSGEEGGLVIEATNPSTNGLIIPTTGWTYTLGSGPTVTITAA
jgi:hypothetical protein